MPSEYCTVEPFPGNWAVVEAGTWLSDDGNVTGRCPPGSIWPNSTLASDVPFVCPGYQASSTPATDDSHGIATGAPALTTTTVCGFAAATAEISSSCADGRFSDSRSVASDSVSSDTTTTAVEAARAAFTASAMPGASADEAPLIDSLYVCPLVSCTAAEYVCTGGVDGSSMICLPSRDRYVGV